MLESVTLKVHTEPFTEVGHYLGSFRGCCWWPLDIYPEGTVGEPNKGEEDRFPTVEDYLKATYGEIQGDIKNFVFIGPLPYSCDVCEMPPVTDPDELACMGF